MQPIVSLKFLASSLRTQTLHWQSSWPHGCDPPTFLPGEASGLSEACCVEPSGGAHGTSSGSRGSPGLAAPPLPPLGRRPSQTFPTGPTPYYSCDKGAIESRSVQRRRLRAPLALGARLRGQPPPESPGHPPHSHPTGATGSLPRRRPCC